MVETMLSRVANSLLLAYLQNVSRLQHLDAAYLYPLSESQLHLCSVALGSQQMPSYSEVRRDDPEGREKPLCVPC